ncbi:MAG TPA: hypothetical protein VII38_08000 [Polyangia bacterium]|jgi:hypothetical protein
MLAQILDRLVAFAARDQAELMHAREEWEERAGRVFDDDPLYEERTTAFLEWYALERVGASGRLPAERFLAEERLEDLDGRWVAALARAHRSLFEVRELKEGAIGLDDLLSGSAFVVTERRKLPGIAEGEIFEARLVANVVTPPEVLFTRAFQFHPREAAGELKRVCEQARKAGEPRAATLFRLLSLRLKALRYGHVAAAKIYAEGGES